MIVKLLTEHHLAFLSLKGGCSGSSVSTLVKMSNCWESHAGAQLLSVTCLGNRAISKEKMDEIQAKINADRKKLEQQKDIANCLNSPPPPH